MPLFPTNANRNARPVLTDEHVSLLTNIIPAYVGLMEADAKVALDHGHDRLAQQFHHQGEKADEILAALEAMEGDSG
jgi:hypothetical protein